MSAFLAHLQLVDHAAIESVQGFRWTPLTAFFVLASSAWIKGPVFVAVAAAGDLRRRRVLPSDALFAGAAAALGAAAAWALKLLFERERPAIADPGLEPLVATPSSASFPSGHAATAFAAAALVATLQPRLRVPAYGVAVVVALSRVYLGVHFPLDVVFGAVLGTAIGLATGSLVIRLRSAPATTFPFLGSVPPSERWRRARSAGSTSRRDAATVQAVK
jgi:undecaprenyl-diphosphatase